MTVVEKAAYLKGLVDGTVQDKPEHKLWSVLCELVADMAHELEDLQENSLAHAEALDDLSDELGSLEESLWQMGIEPSSIYDDELTEEERAFMDSLSNPEENGKLIQFAPTMGLYDEEALADEADLFEDEAEDAETELLDGAEFPEESDEDEDGEDDLLDEILYDITCPVCGAEITLDEETLASGTMNCPHCGEILEFDVSEDE